MVEVRKNLATMFFFVCQDCSEVVLHRFANGCPARWRNDFGDISRVDVDRFPFRSIADFFRWNQNKFSAAFQQITKLIEWFQSNAILLAARFSLRFHPRVAEPRPVTVDDLRVTSFDNLLDRHPPFATAEYVVVGDGEKVVATLAVPIGDHFWKFVTVTPQRVRV